MEYNLRNRILEALLAEKDNRKKIVQKLGVSQEVAEWAHDISDKLSIWIVNSLKKKYESEMEGRSDSITLEDYTQTVNLDYLDIMAMLKKQNRPVVNIKNLSFDDALGYVNRYEYIEAWLNDPAVPSVDLSQLSWDDAEEQARNWHEGLTVGGEIEGIDDGSELVHKFDDGYYWSITKSSKCSASSKSMGHCGTASRGGMYLLHLRKKNKESVTVDWHPEDKYSIQIKGKGNKKPHPKYHKYLIWLIRDSGMIDKLRTEKGYMPNTNFHLGELRPDIAAEIYSQKPGIVDTRAMLKFTPDENRSELIYNLFKYESFLNKLIPLGFGDFFKLVDKENINKVIGVVVKNIDFLKKMNEYPGMLTDTLIRVVDSVSDNLRDKLIESLASTEEIVKMLDEEGEDLLINRHSKPFFIEDKITSSYDSDDMPDEEYDVEYVPESHKRKLRIIKELRNRFGNLL